MKKKNKTYLTIATAVLLITTILVYGKSFLLWLGSLLIWVWWNI